jgi:hypothetical protein
MTTPPPVNGADNQRHVTKYILEKLDSYAHKSHLWQFIHASKIRHTLLRKSRHVSKIHSISEDSVRQCINEFLHKVDQYATQMHRLISSEVSDDFMSAFRHPTKINTAWHGMQLERARQLFATNDATSQQNEADLLETYYRYVHDKLTPKNDFSNAEGMKNTSDTPFDLNNAYAQAENKAKDYLRTILSKAQERKLPNLHIIDEMIQLGRS